jgi:hypothetical protein
MACEQTAALELKKGMKLAAPGSSLLGLETSIAGEEGKSVVEVPTAGFKDLLTLTDETIVAINKRIGRVPANGLVSLLLLDADKNEIARFPLATASTGAGRPAQQAGSQPARPAIDPREQPKKEELPGPAITGNDIDRGARKPELANRANCGEAAKVWKIENTIDWNDGKDTLLVLFNREASVCYESTRVPHVGDTVYVGVVATVDDNITKPVVQFSQCSRERVEPAIYISGDLKPFFNQAGGFGVQIVDARRCFDKEITLTLSMKQGADSVQGTRPISFYERFRGTLQIGALDTDLHENDFALRPADGQSLIFNKEATNDGPEYVASLVVYGIPRYFTKDAFKGGYRGRDILNDNDWRDRLGLVLLAGVDDPTDRFGVGLSFELVYGINLFVARQWFRQRELAGLAEGDVFAGAAADIPIRRHWEEDTAVGLSFDIRYLLALFKGM